MKNKCFAPLICLLSAVLLSSCQSSIQKAARNTTYSAYELIGVQKRELLKSRVDDVKDEQEEASESFEDALTRLKSLYGFKGGELEDRYETLRSSYNKATHQAEDVRKSIRKVDTVAKDLFEEWEKEITEIKTPSLRSKSQESLRKTKLSYSSFYKNLKAAESRMDPVLSKFNDQVLYLKHNLNAQAIASLKGEIISIEKEIEVLIADMNKSIKAAEAFIEEVPTRLN